MLKKKDKLKTAFETFEIVEQIGEGGSGTVYKVKNSDSNFFAAKVINKSQKSSEKIKRFKNEIYFCEKNDNPHIIKVIDHGFLEKTTGEKNQEFMFYIMPLYDNSLRYEIKKGISPLKAIQYFHQLCEGLSYAHNKDCFHRDLKPENILLDKNGKCVIADFGIAHFSNEDKKTIVNTKPTTRLANFTYHAPEQDKLNSEATASVDIFALGLIFNEMITQEVPRGTKYKTVADVSPNYSYLDGLIENMIAQDPANRIKSVKEVCLELSARTQKAQGDKKIAELKRPIPNSDIDDYLFNHPITCEDIEVQKGELIVSLSGKTNKIWIEEYNKNVLPTYNSYPYCYKNFSFSGEKAFYSIHSLGENQIENLIKEFKMAVENTNKNYQSRLVCEKQARELELVKQKQQEIERIENENKLTQSLKKLL